MSEYHVEEKDGVTYYVFANESDAAEYYDKMGLTCGGLCSFGGLFNAIEIKEKNAMTIDKNKFNENNDIENDTKGRLVMNARAFEEDMEGQITHEFSRGGLASCSTHGAMEVM